MLGPCDWPLIFSDCGDDGSCTHLDDMAPPVAAAVMASATYWLWEATSRRYGNCPVTIRPCMRDCNHGLSAPWVPFRTSTGWINVSCGHCGSSCSCSAISELFLPSIGDVLAVETNGISMPSGSWRVDNAQRLVRLDGGTWPRCQDLSADPPTWTVTYVPGLPVPEMGQLAGGALVCQLARRYCGAKCDLPANTTSVTRQGVSITIEPGDTIGLWTVDQWIGLANRPIARVHSPDVPVTRMVGSV